MKAKGKKGENTIRPTVELEDKEKASRLNIGYQSYIKMALTQPPTMQVGAFTQETQR
jgi:predicted DNA binding CopG/RHH family protein